MTIGFGANPTRPDVQAFTGSFAKLAHFRPNGKWTLTGDLGGFEAKSNPDGNAIDSNPYGILVAPGGVIYTDAGGNALNIAHGNGKPQNLAVFPNRLVPFGPGMIPMQAVPTTVAVGPDGALYVGQLTGFPFPTGGANVYRVDAKGNVTTFASGFTNIIDIAFGADGSLYVLEIDADGLTSPKPEGALIKVARDGTRTTILGEGDGLMAPGGIAIGKDGSIYLTNMSVSADGGQVVRVNP